MESGQRTVYVGHRADDAARVVVKVLLHNEAKIARIQREINILNSIDSPYFPHFYSQAFISKASIDDYIDNLDIVTEKEQIVLLRAHPPKPFFVTCEEYIENIGWSDFTKRLSTEVALVDFVTHVFEALQILWNNKIVHRDIKPDNILIRPDLQPVIIDLGIAKSLREGTRNFTVIGIAPCTPQYAAPEQFETGAEITYKADQFAVGVILYHLLTGTYPYGRYDEIEIEGMQENFKKGSTTKITDVNPRVCSQFAQFVHRLLEVQPYKRFRNVSAILSALSEIRRNISC